MEPIDLSNKLIFEIDEKTLKEAAHRCNKDFECLKIENHSCFAEVNRTINYKVYFVNCKNSICNYNLNFGGSNICNCPVRQEVYNKYKK